MTLVGKFGRHTLAGLGLAMSVAGILGCGPAAAQTAIRFSLDFKIAGPSAPFFVALDKGYFKAEGLDVTIEPAAGALESIARIATGTFDMGLGDINALIKFRDANLPSAPKAVFVLYNKPAYAIVARRSRGVQTPKDLEGKVLGAPAADAAYAQWRIFTQANGIDASKVKIETIGSPVREPMLQSGQVDAVIGYSFTSFIDLKSMNVPVNDLVVLLMSDYGVNLYGNTIMVSQKLAAEKPEAVKGFLRAFLKGLRDTVKDPSTAIGAVAAHSDPARKPIELERLRMALKDNVLTPEVKANGYGAVDLDRLGRAIGQIAQTYDFKNKPKAADVFDASFLPPEAERKAR